MSITYYSVLNRINLTGYTAGTPGDFDDLYDADKAGTYSLYDRDGISAADGAAVSTTNALRPADEIVLGGASNDLYITVTNWTSMTTATIRITGTDRDDAAQTEDIVVTGNGTSYTTKWFKTITHTQVTVFTASNGGSFDYELIQGQWGVISKYGANYFEINCRLRIGDTGGTETHFADIRREIVFPNGSVGSGQKCIEPMNNSYFRLGRLINDARKSTTDGCAVFDLNGVGYTGAIWTYAGTCYIELYSLTWIGRNGRSIFYLQHALSTSKIYNCNVMYGVELVTMAANCYNIYMAVASYGFSRVGADTFEKVTIKDISTAFYTHTSGQVAATFKDVITRNCNTDFMFFTNTSLDQTLINCDLDDWDIVFQTGVTAQLLRKYTVNIKVLDKSGNAIQGATVSLEDNADASVFSETTDASGDMAEQTVTYGYYERATAKVLQSNSPHILRIIAKGYETFYNKFELSDKVDWIIPLRRSPYVGRDAMGKEWR